MVLVKNGVVRDNKVPGEPDREMASWVTSRLVYHAQEIVRCSLFTLSWIFSAYNNLNKMNVKLSVTML